MYFKKLEIIGFKSFLNKTVLNFEPGITAVVGPNGCGKSNIFDSIRWVLGEQSVKSLRGSEMQDVIFNGTDTKEPLNMAEVTLTFDNSNRVFNVDHHEVAITRRIFRSGECEYLLNKTQVRLKDILDLLMGTGIGAESYSLVAQGKIDLVLSSRPEDRRLVFDEASGITKYKTQKKEAMRRLEETEQNLLRVNDIVVEVKRQISSLERQANKARKYKDTFEELKTQEIKLSLLQKKDLEKQRDEIARQVTEFEAAQNELLKLIESQEQKISNRQAQLKTAEERVLNIKNQIWNLENSITRGVERTQFNREKIAELETSGQYLEKQSEQVRSRLLLDEEKLEKVRVEYNGIKKNTDEKTALLKEKEAELEQINVSVTSSSENIAKAKRSILDLAARISQSRNDSADANSKQLIYAARKKRLEVEKAKVNEEKAVVGDTLNSITQEVTTLALEFDSVNLKVSGLKGEVDQEVQILNQLSLEIADLEKQKLTLQSQKEFLDKLRTEYEGISESMNALIYLDKLPSERLSGLVVRIKDSTSLSDEDKAYLEPASFKISGEAKPIDLDTQRITEQIDGIEVKISGLKNTQSAKESRIVELNNTIQSIQKEARNLEMVLVNKKAQQDSMQEQFGKIKEEEEIVLLELTDVQNEIASLELKLNELRLQVEALENENRQLEACIVAEQNNITHNSDLKEKVIVTITQTRTELEGLIKRISSDEATLKILEDTYRQDKEGLLNLEKQMQDTLSKRESLGHEVSELETAIAEHKNKIQEQEALLKDAESAYQAVSMEGSDVVKRIEQDRKELDAIKNRIYELQMQNKDIDFKYLSLKERMQQNYKFDVDSLQEAFQPGGQELQGEGGPADDTFALTQQIETLKQRIDSYGTVNLVAIEEYDELKQRYDFLNQQQNDLVSAKESLHEAILKINRTTKKMFLETFESVRQEFRNYFRLLFNGGDAQVYLIDEQDPLESGIEIICRPPGKKLQNVLLLSGGEKSMSAIALIFAIFKVKPSPFCVLDEIDAALDEANVDRFGRMLQDFAKISQFIVITHNKKTIINADIMYGITMEESGVSKIVSVKFGQGQGKDTRVQIKESENVSVQAESVS